jgi:hypothetical protein
MKASLLAKAMCRPFLFLFLLFSTSLMQKAMAQSDVHPQLAYGHPPPTLSDSTPVDVLGHPPPTSILTYIGAGSILPSTTGKDQAYLNNNIGINASVYIPFLKKKTFSLGINAGGEYAASNKDPFNTLPSVFHVIGETSGIVNSSGKSKQQSFNIGAGPQANFYLGNHVMLSPIFLVGYMSLTQNAFSATQTTVIDDNTHMYTLLSQAQSKTNGLALIPKLRFQYFINKRLGFWVEANYVMGPTIKNTVSTFLPEGIPDNNGQYEFQQLQEGTTKTEVRSIKYNAFGVNLGLVMGFGRHGRPHDVPPNK